MTPAPVVLLSGPPGAGKTTTARGLAGTYRHGVHLHGDDFWRAVVAGGVPPYRPEADAQNRTVLAAVGAAARAYADGGYTVVVDAVVGPWLLDHVRSALAGGGTAGGPEGGPEVHYVVLRPPLATTLRRAQARTDPGALVAAEPVRAMWSQFADLGPLEPHALDTAAQSAADTVRTVAAAVAAGTFRLH